MTENNNPEVVSDEELSNAAGGCKDKPKPTSFNGHPLVEYSMNGPCKYGLWAPKDPNGYSEPSGCMGCCHCHFHTMADVEPSCYCDARTV